MFFFSSRRRHTRYWRDWSSDVCSSDLEGAAGAGRDAPPIFGYVRTAVGPDAGERLAKEESFYRDLHDGYRNHFKRLGEPEGTVGVAAADKDQAQAALAAYEALDVPVVRGLASAKVEPMVALAEVAAE